MDISIHAPAKGATIAQINFFIPIYISIHAPAKGATRLRHTLRGSKRISIHAPAKGATLAKLAAACTVYPFQSTLPRRERLGGIMVYYDPAISIHAPAKGATA